MKKFKKIKLLFNNKKLLKEYEELEELVKTQKEIIESLNLEIRENAISTDTQLLIARKQELEGLLDHYHIQKKEYKQEIKELKETVVKLKDEIRNLKHKQA